ncbi:hypothetical protein TNIN_309761 [Trichonephila inaurata madagascariensis]|uniref:Uncharacterized protein n=1 Tax=Trichonephila inaurata madagascariensis TaxID=2747483 RepID=A0A8X7BU66_9ARAC|nr:hypothetical protein TNIN_309761 [Trichonephila inaurata madagascariensis]
MLPSDDKEADHYVLNTEDFFIKPQQFVVHNNKLYFEYLIHPNNKLIQEQQSVFRIPDPPQQAELQMVFRMPDPLLRQTMFQPQSVFPQQQATVFLEPQQQFVFPYLHNNQLLLKKLHLKYHNRNNYRPLIINRLNYIQQILWIFKNASSFDSV